MLRTRSKGNHVLIDYLQWPSGTGLQPQYPLWTLIPSEFRSLWLLISSVLFYSFFFFFNLAKIHLLVMAPGPNSFSSLSPFPYALTAISDSSTGRPCPMSSICHSEPCLHPSSLSLPWEADLHGIQGDSIQGVLCALTSGWIWPSGCLGRRLKGERRMSFDVYIPWAPTCGVVSGWLCPYCPMIVIVSFKETSLHDFLQVSVTTSSMHPCA